MSVVQSWHFPASIGHLKLRLTRDGLTSETTVADQLRGKSGTEQFDIASAIYHNGAYAGLDYTLVDARRPE